MQEQMSTLLDEILTDGLITPLFQPIYELASGDIFGHEALSRGPRGTLLHMPNHLFPFAQQKGRLHELEILCRERAITRYAQLNLGGHLFLNVSASLLSSPYHQKGMTLSILNELGLEQSNIVIELSEQHPYDHNGLTHQSVDHYREMGFQVAIDDLGVGYSGLRLWSELRPDIVKIDKHFVENIDQDDVKREFVRSIVAIARTLKCRVIAEGIERQQELDELIELGIQYGQGYFLGRPTEKPKSEPHAYLVRYTNRRQQFDSDHGESVMSLCRPTPFLDHSALLSDAGIIFKKNKDLASIPVLKDRQPIGVIRRHTLHELFSTPYGRALYEHKSVTNLIADDVIVVESNTSLAAVSTMLTEQDSDVVNSEILIVRGSFYLGTGHLKDLLKRITELKIQNATYSNPLTLLPGNVPIHREVDRRLANRDEFYVAYFDLNDFKPFNDYFGYAKGDTVIQMLGSIIKVEVTGENNFIGHIGGDDFVVIFADEDWQQQCERILHSFYLSVLELYDEATRQEGGVWSKNREGDLRFHPILSLAIGVVNPNPDECDSHHYVAELAAQAKKAAKQKGGNAIYLQPYQNSYANLASQAQEALEC